MDTRSNSTAENKMIQLVIKLESRSQL